MAEKSESDAMNLGNGTHLGRFTHLIESGEYSDLVVIVGGNKERIKAHKLILMVASPVFKKLLMGEMMKKEIEIPQMEPDIFKRFLQFIYTGEACMDWKYGIPLLNAAKYYKLPDLESICEKIVDKSLNKENVLTILQQSVTYQEKKYVAEAVKILCPFAHEIVEKKEFLELTAECLEEIVDKDELAVRDEMQFFEACVRWSEAECLRQSTPVTPKLCRSILEKIIPHIRFPLMDAGDFSLQVAPRNILTTDELVSILLNFNIPSSKRSMAQKGIFKSNPRQYKNTREREYIAREELQYEILEKAPNLISEMSLPFKVGLYRHVKSTWPQSGCHILGTFDENTIVLYHAYNTDIATHAVINQTFLNCAKFGLRRMTGFKPNFLSMMYRSGWAMKPYQTNILAITITREGFEEMLRNSSPFKGLSVTGHWTPDYDPRGRTQERRVIQLGVKGEILDRLLHEWIVKIEDVTDFVIQQRRFVLNNQLDLLQVPQEKIYTLLDQSLVAKIGLNWFRA